jgi:hypothetical protein
MFGPFVITSLSVYTLDSKHCNIFMFTYWCVCVCVCVHHFLSFRYPVPCILNNVNVHQPITVTERSKARVCGFESCRGHGCVSLGSVLCCQVEVSATGRSLVYRDPTQCVGSLCEIEKPQEWGGLSPRWAVASEEHKNVHQLYRVSLSTHPSPKWGILRSTVCSCCLDGQHLLSNSAFKILF